MGMKHRVDFGVYIIYGSINVQLASVTGFTNQDADDIKYALKTLFRNDASSARAEGSMEVCKLIWWEHNNSIGQYSTAKVHRSLNISKKDGIIDANSINDYCVEVQQLDELDFEICDGE
jgi:CRISPR-associated protein Csd2